jgi:hypothetical protein
MIRRGHYSSNNFQDSTKRKSTEKKTLGYLPRVLFFNAFELGAKSRNQVFSNKGALISPDALRLPLLPSYLWGTHDDYMVESDGAVMNNARELVGV